MQLHPLGVNPPALFPQQLGDPAITVAAIRAGQLDDGPSQRSLVIRYHPRLALGRARLANGATGPPLRNP